MKVTKGEHLSGRYGSADEILTTLEPGDRPDVAAVVSSWFLTCPRQSPIWNDYSLSMIHLRTVPGGQPPRLQFPEATHELLLAALDPRENPRADNPYRWFYLRPINLCEQLTLRNDAAAAALCRAGVEELVAGRLWAEPPHPQSREPWRAFLRRHAATI